VSACQRLGDGAGWGGTALSVGLLSSLVRVEAVLLLRDSAGLFCGGAGAGVLRDVVSLSGWYLTA
jgi:hypothetical protein